MSYKNTRIVIAFVALLVVGFFAVRALTNNQESVSTPIPAAGTAEEQAIMHQEFPGVPESNRFAKESADQIMERFESGTGIIFLGFKECPWCQKMAPILNEAAEFEGTNIYYTDIRKLNADSPADYQQLMAVLLPYLPKSANGQPRVSTPDISFVKNGDIVWRYEVDSVTDEERTPEAYWTQARKERTATKLRSEMKQLK